MKVFTCTIIVFLLFLSIDVFASTKTYERTEENGYLVSDENIVVDDSKIDAVLSTPAVDEAEKIYDFADLYTDEQEKELYSLVTNYIDDYDLDLAIVTIKENTKDSTEAYAQDFYDYNSFGITDSHNGILFLVDMANREFYMLNSGAGITMYTDRRVDECLDAAFSEIASGNYYGGTKAFIEKAGYYAKVGEPDEAGNEPKLKGVLKLQSMSWSSIAIFSVIATAVVMFIFISNNKLVRSATSSKFYLTKADVNVVKETFLGKNINKVMRVHDSGSSGSSSSGGSSRSVSHGSSGRSHSGGGRKF